MLYPQCHSPSPNVYSGVGLVSISWLQNRHDCWEFILCFENTNHFIGWYNCPTMPIVRKSTHSFRWPMAKIHKHGKQHAASWTTWRSGGTHHSPAYWGPDAPWSFASSAHHSNLASKILQRGAYEQVGKWGLVLFLVAPNYEVVFLYYSLLKCYITMEHHHF